MHYLGLSDLWLTEIPNEIGELSNLQELSMGKNPITALPESVGGWRSLKHLTAQRCSIASLPASIAGWREIESPFFPGSYPGNSPQHYTSPMPQRSFRVPTRKAPPQSPIP